jgi:hypothetical protein
MLDTVGTEEMRQFALAPPWVVESLTKDAAHIHVGHHKILSKGPATGHHLPPLVNDYTAAIEDQLILSAYLVAEGNHGHVVGGASRQHSLSLLNLAQVIGRGRDVD